MSILLWEYNKLCPIDGRRMDATAQEYALSIQGECLTIKACYHHTLAEFYPSYPNAHIDWTLAYPVCDECHCPTPIQDLTQWKDENLLLCDACYCDMRDHS